MSYKTRSWLTVAIMFFACWLGSGLFLGICAAVGVYYGTRIGYKTRAHALYFERNRIHFYGTVVFGLGLMLLGIAMQFPPVYGLGLTIFESMFFMEIAYAEFGA